MAFELQSALPPVPPGVLDEHGQPRLGAYHGNFGELDLRRRTGPLPLGRLRRLFKLKRWQWGMVATHELLAGWAIVDVGYAANAFVFVVDLAKGRRLVDKSFLGVPVLGIALSDRPGEGLRASFRAPGCSMRVTRARGTAAYLVDFEAGDLSLEAVLDSAPAPEPLAVVMKAKGGDVSCTQKNTLLPSAGTLRLGARQWSLGGGFGGLDYTHGLLARNTAWRWAFAVGRTTEGQEISFNLQDGLGDPGVSENLVWLGRELVPVGLPRFTFDTKKPEGPWLIRTDDGAVDLRFNAKGLHAEDRNLLLVRSHFVQVAGVFSGTIRDRAGRTHVVEGLPGVTEDQRVVW